MVPHPAPIDLPLDLNEAGSTFRWARLVQDGLSDDAIRRYPDLAQLTQRLARLWKVDAERLVVTAGADEALDRICRCFLRPGQGAIIPSPTFQNLPRHARLAGAELIEPVWLDRTFPIDAVLAAIGPSIGLIAVVSPNNPTGQVVTAAQLKRIAERAGEIPVVVDLAYVEYDDETLLDTALTLPNAIVVRTLSKGWGLAGLRIGGACGARHWIDRLRSVGGTFSVASSSAAIALQVLESVEQQPELSQARLAGIAQVRSERDRLSALATRLGVESEPSRGNFVLWRTPRAGWLDDALRGLGIAVRPVALPDRSEPALRITCPGDAGSFARLCAALEAALDPQALLFDLDLVLPEHRRWIAWSQRWPLAIITGRTRRDAERFLSEHGLRDAVSALVTLEDGPSKPDPAPVRTALARLNVERAWLIGDNPDDARAARAAGVVALGRVAPGDDPEPTALALLTAGAARIVESWDQLEELLGAIGSTRDLEGPGKI